MPTHIVEGDFEDHFPESADVFPTVEDNENYLDAVIFNKFRERLLAVENYLITYRVNIETEGGLGGLGISVPVSNVAANSQEGITGEGVGLGGAIMGQTVGSSVS